MSPAVLAFMTLALAPPSGTSALDGTWVSDCLPFGRGGRHGLVAQVTFSGDRIEATAQMYAASSCDSPTLRVAYQGQVLHAEATDGKVLFDHTIGSVVLTPQAPDVVAIYNREGDPRGCGLKDWKVNEEKSVAGRSCDPFTFATEKTTLYDAAWLDGDTLRFGAAPTLWSNTAPDKRPAQPLPSSYHRKGG